MTELSIRPEEIRDALQKYVEDYQPSAASKEEVGHVAEAGDGRAWFNVGWLQAREAGAIRRCSGALREVAGASAYWDR